MLVYAASGDINPTQYFVVFLRAGRVCVSLETGGSADVTVTKNICSRHDSYADTEWHTVSASRVLPCVRYVCVNVDSACKTFIHIAPYAAGNNVIIYFLQVEILRINDFIAIIIENDGDYVNNNVISSERTSLEVNTAMYIGGVARDVIPNSAPFGTQHVMNLETTSFHGCIRHVDVTRSQTDSDVTSSQLEFASLPLE